MKSARNSAGPVSLARLTAGLLDPVTARRGFAKGDLIASWGEIVGPRFAESTMPEKLVWPRGAHDRATLTVRVAGPQAVFLQHETEQFVARINAFFGYGAVATLRIVQRPLPPRRAAPRAEPALSSQKAAEIDKAVAGIDADGLRAALTRLGQAIARDRIAMP